jgi:hypothetical protein
MITLYDYPPSQNAYKVRLLCIRLHQPRRRGRHRFDGLSRGHRVARACPIAAQFSRHRPSLFDRP